MTSAYRDIATAYQGVENLDDFEPGTLESYRNDLLQRTSVQAAFIRERLPEKAKVVEIASGNGRLLLALRQAGAVAEALGIEISESRVAFAKRWVEDAGVDGIHFLTADALSAPLPSSQDGVACITSAFAYFDAVRFGAGVELLRRVHAALRKGGLIVLELYPHARWRTQMEASGTDELKIWSELPSSDPWRFYLSDLKLDEATDVLTHRKTFIHRTSGEIDDSRREHLRLFNQHTINSALIEAGFGEISFFGEWSGRPHEPADELLIVTARS